MKIKKASCSSLTTFPFLSGGPAAAGGRVCDGSRVPHHRGARRPLHGRRPHGARPGSTPPPSPLSLRAVFTQYCTSAATRARESDKPDPEPQIGHARTRITSHTNALNIICRLGCMGRARPPSATKDHKKGSLGRPPSPTPHHQNQS